MSLVRELSFYLNSRERDNQNTTNRSLSTWTLPVPITARAPQNIFRIGVSSFSSPASMFYSFDGEYVRAIYENGGDVTHYMPLGNYSVQTFMAWFHSSFTNIADVSLAGQGSRPDHINFNFGNNHYGSLYFSPTLAQCIGNGDYNIDIQIAQGQTVMCPFPYNFCPDRSIMVNLVNGISDSYSAMQQGIEFTDPNLDPSYVNVPVPEFRTIARIGVQTDQQAISCPSVNYEANNIAFSNIPTTILTFLGICLGTEQFPIINLLQNYSICIIIQEIGTVLNVAVGIPEPVTLPSFHAEKSEKGRQLTLHELAKRIKEKRLKKLLQHG